MRELLPENAGRVALELVRIVLRRISRRCADEQVNVVGHDLQLCDRQVQHGGTFVKQFFEPRFDVADKHRLSVLDTPNKVVVEAKNTSCCLPVSLLRHDFIIPQALYKCQLFNEN